MYAALDPPVGGQELTRVVSPSLLHPRSSWPAAGSLTSFVSGMWEAALLPTLALETREMPLESCLLRTKLGMFLILQQSNRIGVYLCLSNVWLGHGVLHCGSG